jgi:hypothetical protein
VAGALVSGLSAGWSLAMVRVRVGSVDVVSRLEVPFVCACSQRFAG